MSLSSKINLSMDFANDSESLGLTKKPLKLFLQISLQPGTFVEINGSLQLAASNKLLGKPSRYDGKIDIFDFWRKGITFSTLGFHIIKFSLTQKFN